MSCIEKVKEALLGITADVTDDDAKDHLMALLPEGKRSAEARCIVVQLVVAQKSRLRQDSIYQQYSKTIAEIEADPEDERGANLRSYEAVANTAATLLGQTDEFSHSLLVHLAELLGEESPDDKPDPDEMGVSFSLQEPLTDYYLGPRPEGCALPAVVIISLLMTTTFLVVLR
jgi:hypothetical protein